ncbi:glycine cleavage system protein GcvH [Dactylosporangium sp. NBC_01737]|uniref:glycine cleavage system protein GcvH n=1 Tax=Dactylosporangium sp. NBC_01737 TaxID=2975959 RepID=UPI002E12E72E|nr:glycine cleavage system protein GcvH [Dactylosporangium sp. NBC_01737]
MPAIPPHLSYTRDHEWLHDGRVGITAFAADALGDIVYVRLPDLGATVTAGVPCGEIESTKSVSELLAPADGTVVEVNAALAEEPGLVNDDPYERGWLFKLAVTGTPDLLDAAAYTALAG